MSLGTITTALGQALGKVPPEAWDSIARLVSNICGTGKDAKRVAERQLAVFAADQAADAALREGLKRGGGR